MRRALSIAALAAVTMVACGEDDPAANPGAGGQNAGGEGGTGAGTLTGGSAGYAGSVDPPDVDVCEPGGMLTQPVAPQPVAVFITSDELASSFDAFAHLHTLLGTPATVVTTQQICAGQCNDADPTRDTAQHIKQWLVGQPTIRYAILGGDIEHVPSRKVKDKYKNPFLLDYTFDEEFFSDYYYADFSEWDANGDGLYAQDGSDQPEYRPDIAVSRIPVSTSDEADRYLEKVRRYLTQYESSHASEVLLLSNVATEFLGIDVDGAWYFGAEGRTLDLLPEGSSVRRLYATGMEGAETNTVARQIEAIEQGYNLVVHSGHGSVKSLTVEYSGSESMTGSMAQDLKNTTYPIFLSSACEAGKFSANDAAGEMLMNATSGGAIAYLGNSVIGLGLAGGMQMIDELLRYVQQTPYPVLGDALFMAHDNMPEKDTFITPVGGIALPVVDKDSYEWTQKSATMFGDILIPVWKGSIGTAPALEVIVTETCEGMRLEVVSTPPVDGLARVHAGVSYYEVMLKNGRGWLHVEGQSEVEVGFVLPGQKAALQSYP